MTLLCKTSLTTTTRLMKTKVTQDSLRSKPTKRKEPKRTADHSNQRTRTNHLRETQATAMLTSVAFWDCHHLHHQHHHHTVEAAAEAAEADSRMLLLPM